MTRIESQKGREWRGSSLYWSSRKRGSSDGDGMGFFFLLFLNQKEIKRGTAQLRLTEQSTNQCKPQHEHEHTPPLPWGNGLKRMFVSSPVSWPAEERAALLRTPGAALQPVASADESAPAYCVSSGSLCRTLAIEGFDL